MAEVVLDAVKKLTKKQQQILDAWNLLVADVIDAKAAVKSAVDDLSDAQVLFATNPADDTRAALRDATAALERKRAALVAAQKAMKAGVQ